MLRGLAGKRILVTGASGFIGESLCRQLANLDAHVTGLSRFSQDDNSINWIKCDVTDNEAVLHAVDAARPEIVYHLASAVTGSQSLEWVERTFHSNLASTVYLLNACSTYGVKRFVQIGSQEEPDDNSGHNVANSPYAAAKAASTSYVRMFHQLYGLGVVNLRVFMVYGPGQKDLKKLIPYCILESLAGRSPRVGAGKRKVDWIYVEDVVRAMLLAGIVPNIEGKRFEIGTGELTSIRDVVLTVVSEANALLQPEFRSDERVAETEYAAKIENAANLLKWAPQVAITEGLRRTVAWYAKQSSSVGLDSVRIEGAHIATPTPHFVPTESSRKSLQADRPDFRGS